MSGYKLGRFFYKCKDSFIFFLLQMNRQRHHCQLCPQSYSQMGKLRFHISLVHDSVTDQNKNKVESATCSYCQRVLSSKYAKLRHESIVHMNKKDYHCEVCDKYISTIYGLRRHLAANHGGQKLKCDLCSAEFSYPHTLKEHTERCSNKKTKKILLLPVRGRIYHQKSIKSSFSRTTLQQHPCL